MRSCYCPVHQYNKDKPDKLCVGFFILANAKYLFIYYLDVYQGKNKNNIEFHPDVINLPVTQKAVRNAILQSGIVNDSNGMQHFFFDSKCAAPQLLGIIQMEWNLLAVVTCRANRKGFPSDDLDLNKCAVQRICLQG
eukprot:11424694-Ditylum_brightwellii.AAC.1